MCLVFCGDYMIPYIWSARFFANSFKMFCFLGVRSLSYLVEQPTSAKCRCGLFLLLFSLFIGWMISHRLFLCDHTPDDLNKGSGCNAQREHCLESAIIYDSYFSLCHMFLLCQYLYLITPLLIVKGPFGTASNRSKRAFKAVRFHLCKNGLKFFYVTMVTDQNERGKTLESPKSK